MGRALILVPVLSYIPLRVLVGDWEESHHAAVLSISLFVSGVITLAVAAIADRKTGIEVFSRHAWTGGLLESRHLFLHLPIRVVGVLFLIGSPLVFLA